MKCILSALAALALLTGARADDKSAKPESTAPAAKKYKNIDAETFERMRKSEKDAVVLDVRTKEEYANGHIAGSKLLDFQAPDFEKELAKLDKNKTYLVHCAAGGRSARACKKMDALDFSKVYNLQGGMAAWEKAGEPVEK